MGLADYLGHGWRSKAGLPIVNVPGCPVQPDNLSETITYLLHQVNGKAPMIPLDNELRPTWLFGKTVHEGCDRAGYYEQGNFAKEYGDPRCLVKIGCWGPVIKCNVPKRGWMDGIGGCPNVGGICMACTMPGFPDKFMPFMDEPPGARLSTQAIGVYGAVIRTLRSFTQGAADREPKWRARAPVNKALEVASSKRTSLGALKGEAPQARDLKRMPAIGKSREPAPAPIVAAAPKHH
jgi:hydrogenase small subunit